MKKIISLLVSIIILLTTFMYSNAAPSACFNVSGSHSWKNSSDTSYSETGILEKLENSSLTGEQIPSGFTPGYITSSPVGEEGGEDEPGDEGFVDIYDGDFLSMETGVYTSDHLTELEACFNISIQLNEGEEWVLYYEDSSAPPYFRTTDSHFCLQPISAGTYFVRREGDGVLGNFNSLHLTIEDTVVNICEGEPLAPSNDGEQTIGGYYALLNMTAPGEYKMIKYTIVPTPRYLLTESYSVCSGDSHTFPDGTTQTNITSQVVHTSNLTTIMGCDSIITTTVTVNPVYNLTETVSVCSGDSHTFPDGTTQTNITSQVVHTSNLTTIMGCDSIITTTVIVNPVYNLTEAVSVCSGNSHTFPDGTTQTNITSQVIHTSNLTTIMGCDSIITTTVTVNPVYNLTEAVTVCSGDSWTFPDGSTLQNITTSLTHNSNLKTILGCDSIITTTITVNPIYKTEEYGSVCQGESYTYPDGFTEENIQSHTGHISYFKTRLGCDSIITTLVYVNPSYHLSDTVTICKGESYTFPDGTTQNNITEDQMYISFLQTEKKCDSIIVSFIYINPDYHIKTYNTICEGDSYTFPDGNTIKNITEDLIYMSNLSTQNGCDSVISSIINVNPVYSVNQEASVCMGESYIFPDGTTMENITEDLIYLSYLKTHQGCDSTIISKIHVDPVYSINESASVCSGESLTFPDGVTLDNITENMIYESHLKTESGCDSLIHTTVYVKPSYLLEEEVALCSGESYTFPDKSIMNNITEDLIHMSMLQTQFGCDSIIRTSVVVMPVWNTDQNVSICSGSGYTFPDGVSRENITGNLVYTSYLITQTGCDSIITTNLFVNPVWEQNETISLCKKDNYIFPDGTTMENITETTEHSSYLKTYLNCDSIINTTILIKETDTGIRLDNNTLRANASGANYQWVDCRNNYSLIDGAVLQSYTPIVSGEYAVIVTQNGCSDTSKCINVTSVGTPAMITDNTIEIFPNPTSGNIRITLNEEKSTVILTLRDLTGRVLDIKKGNSIRELGYQIEGIRGFYIIELAVDQNISIFKILKL